MKEVHKKLDKISSDIEEIKALQEEVKKNTAFRQNHVGAYKFIGWGLAAFGTIWVSLKHWMGN